MIPQNYFSTVLTTHSCKRFVNSCPQCHDLAHLSFYLINQDWFTKILIEVAVTCSSMQETELEPRRYLKSFFTYLWRLEESTIILENFLLNSEIFVSCFAFTKGYQISAYSPATAITLHSDDCFTGRKSHDLSNCFLMNM